MSQTPMTKTRPAIQRLRHSIQRCTGTFWTFEFPISCLFRPFVLRISDSPRTICRTIAHGHLDAVLADSSGYIAADELELCDGPFCVLSIVDHRSFRRITCDVLDHDPTQADMERFLRTVQAALDQRGLTVRGDGSDLYPKPISHVFGLVPHQICPFHVIKELTKAVLRRWPRCGRNRPPRNRNSAAGVRLRRQRAGRLAGAVGSIRRRRICSSIASCSSSVTRPRLSGERCSGSPAACPNGETFAPSWSKSISRSIVAAVAERPWRNGPDSAAAQAASSESPIRLKKRSSPNLEKGAYGPRRRTPCLDIQRRGARLPASPQDAKDRLPRPHATGDLLADCPGHGA